ncbi:MAG: ChaN family lipoprotein [Proteobacteria bacterium]|nr:ChaN family lipoprotein [Pseudomonadota bacterium]
MLIALFLQSCALPTLPEWRSAHGRDHPLVGIIYRTSDGQFVAPATLAAELPRADFVLLGEKHDNPDHHSLQAWLVRALIGAGRHPAVALEMLSEDQAPRLAAYLARPDAGAAGLGPAVGWERSGWPAWPDYAPIADAALAGHAPIVAADLPRALQRAIGRDGIAAQPADLIARLALDVPYVAAQTASLETELIDEHCGALPRASLPRMLDVQRARDAAFARAMIVGAQLPGADSAVLIAGSGHVRGDRGVPWHLRRLAPGRAIATVAFVEIDDERRMPGDYGAAVGEPSAFDYVWFTPRVDDADPCVKFREQLQRLRQPPATTPGQN